MTVPGALGSSVRTAADVALSLRQEFQSEFQRQFDRAPMPDPVLGVLFQSLAVLVGRVYQEAEDVFPWQVLDDLISGLGMPRPAALPAQTVVAFSNIDRRERISSELALEGTSARGERFAFAPDASIELSDTVLRFAAVAEGGRLHVIPGATLPSGTPWPTGAVPCAAADGPPAVLLAFECDSAHLGGLGLHLKTGSIGGPVAAALARSAWIILDSDGVSRELGVLRGRTGRGGVSQLDFADFAEAERSKSAESPLPLDVGRGPYGEQVWIFPQIPVERRWRGAPPARFRDAVESLLPGELAGVMQRELAWVYIPLPAGTTSIVNSLMGIVLHAVTASNLEVFEETIRFERTGTVASFRPEGAGNRFVMGLLSVIGEGGTRYVPESDLEAPSDAGRYRLREGLIEMKPARRTGGRLDSYAKVRLMLCDGHRGNELEAGTVRVIRGKRSNVTAQVVNVTSSRGGAAPPDYSTAKDRFAELLRTRERVVTLADFDISARAFDSRIEKVVVTSVSEVANGALQAVDLVRASVPSKLFADPDADAARLQHGLQQHLEQRAMLGRKVRVSVDRTDA